MGVSGGIYLQKVTEYKGGRSGYHLELDLLQVTLSIKKKCLDLDLW